MDEVNWAQIMVELFLLAGAFIVMYWKQRVEAEHRFTKVEILVSRLSADHESLATKVDGISRNLAAVSGELRNK